MIVFVVMGRHQRRLDRDAFLLRILHPGHPLPAEPGAAPRPAGQDTFDTFDHGADSEYIWFETVATQTGLAETESRRFG